jgi:hypothetical protein
LEKPLPTALRVPGSWHWKERVMGQRIDTQEQVIQVIWDFRRGVFCPSEMWMQVAEILTGTSGAAILDSLPRHTKERLCAVWLAYPPAAYIARPSAEPGEMAFQATCAEVVRWCEANSPPREGPAEPDGLIRVRVEGGLVKEWRPWEETGLPDQRTSA